MSGTHGSITWRRFARSRRAIFGFVLLGILALAGVFAEIVASPAPILARGPAGTAVLPGILHASQYAARTRAEIDKLHEDGAVLLAS